MKAVPCAALSALAGVWLFAAGFALRPAPLQPWQLMNISGHLPDLRFSLIDDSGARVTAQSYHGNITLLYFGFTGCAAQCPLTLARLSQLLPALGGAAAPIRVLFVTVDPAHDTPAVLRTYLAAFPATPMTGLTGSNTDIAALARRMRAAYRPAAGGEITHSNVIYLFDAAGRARLLATPEDSDAALLHDLRQLAHAS